MHASRHCLVRPSTPRIPSAFRRSDGGLELGVEPDLDELELSLEVEGVDKDDEGPLLESYDRPLAGFRGAAFLVDVANVHRTP